MARQQRKYRTTAPLRHRHTTMRIERLEPRTLLAGVADLGADSAFPPASDTAFESSDHPRDEITRHVALAADPTTREFSGVPAFKSADDSAMPTKISEAANGNVRSNCRPDTIDDYVGKEEEICQPDPPVVETSEAEQDAATDIEPVQMFDGSLRITGSGVKSAADVETQMRSSPIAIVATSPSAPLRSTPQTASLAPKEIGFASSSPFRYFQNPNQSENDALDSLRTESIAKYAVAETYMAFELLAAGEVIEPEAQQSVDHVSRHIAERDQAGTERQVASSSRHVLSTPPPIESSQVRVLMNKGTSALELAAEAIRDADAEIAATQRNREQDSMPVETVSAKLPINALAATGGESLVEADESVRGSGFATQMKITLYGMISLMLTIRPKSAAVALIPRNPFATAKTE